MDEDEKKSGAKTFGRLLKYAVPYIGHLTLCLVLVLALTVFELMKTDIFGDAIDSFDNGGGFELIKSLSIKYLLVVLLIFVCNMVQTWLLAYTGQGIIFNMREEIYAHVQSLALRFFDTTPVGRIVTRITNDVESLNEMFTNVLIRLIKNVVKIIGLMVYMLILDVRLALISFILIPIVAVMTVVFRTISRTTYRVVRTKLSALNTYLSEHLSGMKLIQAFAKEDVKNHEFFDKAEDLYHASFREMMVFAIFRPIMYILSIIAVCTILEVGGLEVISGAITYGLLYKFVDYVKQFFEPIQELAEQFGTLQQSIASAEKIFTILDDDTKIPEPAQPVALDNVKGRIEFSHVWFAYNKEDWVLKDVSFVIEPGSSAAFVGATGAGKSSILNLIGRYYDIQKGSITIDGVDIKEVSLADLRHAIGQVQQDVFLFTGDVKSNIRLREASISDETIEKAAKHVNADRFISKLPKKYDEAVTERGSTFSAGERQLISFARTLAYDPKILVLDEATANIDTETESLIQDALGKLMNGRTSIVVAHRLSTIQHADKIMVMDHGQLVESGTHQELIGIDDGVYKKLYELQLESAEAV